MKSVFGLLAILWCSMGTAAEAVRVTAGSGVPNPQEPQAAVTEEGIIYVAFGSGGTVHCCRSTDGGKTYDPPVQVGEVTKLALGRRRGPRIVASRDAVVITAISHDSGNLLAWRSADGGKTWQGPVTVNDLPRVAREGLHAMAMGPSGDVHCVWLDLRNKGMQIYGASSADGGKTWSENRFIYRSPSGGVCPCCHPSVTCDSAGQVHVMWRNAVEGKRDMYVATSRDGGQTFAPAVKLGLGSWELDACPMDGGSLAATAPGKLTTIWRRDKGIYKTSPGQPREEWLGLGEQPWAAATSEGAWLTWLSRRGDNLWLLAPDAQRPEKLATSANDPMLATPVTGKGPIIAVWQTGNGRNTEIMAAVVAR